MFLQLSKTGLWLSQQLFDIYPAQVHTTYTPKKYIDSMESPDKLPKMDTELALIQMGCAVPDCVGIALYVGEVTLPYERHATRRYVCGEHAVKEAK